MQLVNISLACLLKNYKESRKEINVFFLAVISLSLNCCSNIFLFKNLTSYEDILHFYHTIIIVSLVDRSMSFSNVLTILRYSKLRV